MNGRGDFEETIQASLSAPEHLLSVWEKVRRRIRRASGLALFTDFDGTLTPIVASPGEAQLPKQVRESLAAVAKKGVLVAVVSGRSLAELRRQVGLRGIWYVGAHGYSMAAPGRRPRLWVSRAQRAEMSRIRRLLSDRLRGAAGIRLEAKDASVAVHYRQAARRERERAAAAVREILEGAPHLRLLPGKKVWEVLPDSRADKSSAIEFILRRQGERSRRLWFYLGDDVTDERVFARMKGKRTTGLSVAVGKRRRTGARFFLRSPAEVGRFLQKFLEAIP